MGHFGSAAEGDQKPKEQQEDVLPERHDVPAEVEAAEVLRTLWSNVVKAAVEATSRLRAQQLEEIEAVENEALEVDPEAMLHHEEVPAAEAPMHHVDAHLVLEEQPENRLVPHEPQIEDRLLCAVLRGTQRLVQVLSP